MINAPLGYACYLNIFECKVWKTNDKRLSDFIAEEADYAIFKPRPIIHAYISSFLIERTDSAVVAVGSSSIYRISPVDSGLTPSGQPASLRCQLETSDNFRLHYVTWFKISREDDAQREFVYHYDRCTGEERAYGGLAGRATVGLTVTSHNSTDEVSPADHFDVINSCCILQSSAVTVLWTAKLLFSG